MKTLATTLLLATASLAQAQEIGQVISRTAVYQQVAVPRQTCSQTPVAVQNPSSGGGALMGAIAGGAVGSQIGGGSGQALAELISGKRPALNFGFCGDALPASRPFVAAQRQPG